MEQNIESTWPKLQIKSKCFVEEFVKDVDLHTFLVVLSRWWVQLGYSEHEWSQFVHMSFKAWELCLQLESVVNSDLYKSSEWRKSIIMDYFCSYSSILFLLEWLGERYRRQRVLYDICSINISMKNCKDIEKNVL